jgi:RNA polymerase sigma factor (sigma-70 family)
MDRMGGCELGVTQPSDDLSGARLGSERVRISAPAVTSSSTLPDELTAQRLSAFARTDYQRVLRVVRYVCGAGVDAEGAVAEAMARALEVRSRGVAIENLAGWVARTATNLGRSERRHLLVRARRAHLLAGPGSSSEHAEQVVESLVLKTAVERLPRRQAQVVALRYGLDLTIAEAAEVLGISDGGTRALLAKARRSLAKTCQLPDEGGDDEPT